MYRSINQIEMPSLFRHGVQLLTKSGPQLSKITRNIHITSASCQGERKCEEIRIPVPWGHIAGKWWGPQDQRPILCLHGWQESCGSFDPLMQLLPEDTGFLALDIPGHGHSSRMPKGMFYHAIDSVIMFRRIQRYFDWAKLSFMSHSMGAAISFMYSALYPDEVDFLIQFDLFKPFSQRPGTAIGSTVENIDKFIKYDELNDAATPPPAYTYEQLVQRICEATRNSLQPHNAKYVLNRIIRKSANDPAKYIFARDNRLKVGTLIGFQHDDICEYARRVQCPLLSIKATQSTYFDKRKDVEAVADIHRANNKDYEFVFVEGTHHVHINEPEKVAAVVIKFLAKYNNMDRSAGGGIRKEIILGSS